MSYSVSEAFQRIEEEMITSMARNLKRHVDWEKKEGFEWTAWQAEQLAALKEYREQSKEVFTDYFSTINDKIGEVIQEAYESGNQDQETEILKAIKDGFELPASKAVGNFQGSFFKINQRKINALIKATKGEMRAAETAMLRMNDDSYRKTIFDAVTYYNTGAGTLPQCVDMATKDFLSRGINCIEYSNGARVGIDVYARMALRTAQTRAYVQGEATKRDEWGINTVIVNKRGVACPRCLKYVGKVFYDDVWGSIAVPDGKYPLLSDAISGGLYHPNCKDIHTTYFEGISTPTEKMTKAQVDEANRVYKLEQLQRGYERNIRKYKRLSAGSIDPENRKLYEAKLKEWQKAQAEFIEEHSDVLKRRPELEKIFPEPTGFNPVAPASPASPKPKAAEPKKPTFKPASAIKEAEEYISKYVDGNQFGALGVSYAGVDLGVANTVNKTLGDLMDTYGADKLGGIIAPAGNTKLGKQISHATAAYSPVRNSFILNRASFKNMVVAQKRFEAETQAIRGLLEHPERYDFSKISGRVRNVIERSKKSGRATVPTSIEEALTHEFGHYLEKRVKASDLWKEALANKDKFADAISGYAGSDASEYVAESFTSYMKGENVIDPVMKKIFEGLRK